MKKIVCILTLVITLTKFTCNAMEMGQIASQAVVNNATETTFIYWTSQVQTYTTGGVTFTYPGNLFLSSIFTSAPLALISVAPLASHPDTETYTAEISNNSATSATVMVYLVDSLTSTVSEAPNGSVEVCFLALGS